MKDIRVFVYGTLKRGYFNHMRCLYGRPNVEFVGTAETVNKLTLYDMGPFPFVTKDGKGVSTIKGEVFNIDAEVFADLDHLEGYPGEGYDRCEIPVRLADGTKTTAWIYIMDVKVPERKNMTKHYPKVLNGVWRNGQLEIRDMEEYSKQCIGWR
jgi:gamma-glutamylcyclotransferase (GGCT)/AIG2-like uncharacterized protein YtfP